MKNLHISAAPHIHSGVGTSNIMLDVVIALLPAAVNMGSGGNVKVFHQFFPSSFSFCAAA